ncbi:hypothetical protein C5B42_02510 [Candidatus Cerribacteria bacterium 'Amazon FNV 2010 28 9']|uniref:LysM domain-containing protein n=1 Tax=Candidatus Cerribacteria bacterium 'Amazon FNV 2010 28 9' TaxID=2081795 RepID=A0A317JP07_9BACT|nr:MAG: hypothetical protein C5B42_02510 [Candidatus Cerribacteria bacterium 'Amazon FNV 2010 28 9']
MDGSFASFTKKLSQYESEISSILGMLVVAALAVFIFLFVKRFMPKPTITPVADQTSTQQAAQDLINKTDTNAYTVKAGQGLSQIAKEVYGNGAKWKQIADANNVKAPYTLKAGQTLTIPQDQAATDMGTAQTVTSSTAVAPVQTSTASITPSTTTAAIDATYTVKKGDHLWKIALTEYGSGYSWVKIYSANKKLIGKNPGVIRPGMQLSLPR